ncbi:unnamed protein product [Rotaria sordida]|uniref:Uncharacterized protein n=1 Tax=Rotaria sordida TaxID=392033 RepID=A0A814WPQ0_9BILA|nr:unnamed protein product [Rotaria sordida]
MFELNKNLMQMMNEILAPGISTVDEYNECMKLTARALIDYGYNQSVEHIDDDDVNEFLLSTDILLPNNRTDIMMNEILAPGISTVDEYNECMKLTARALIDYGYNQSVEHMDDDDVNEFLLSTDILLPNNRTDM